VLVRLPSERLGSRSNLDFCESYIVSDWESSEIVESYWNAGWWWTVAMFRSLE
jgi:hypothetical protein